MNKADVIGLTDYNSNDLIIKSFTNEVDENKISLALNYVDLIKGKKSQDGEERVYKNRIFIKKGRHWVEKDKGKTLKSHAREVGEHELERTIKESGDPLLRQHAHSELKRRQKYEYRNKDSK